MQKKIIALAVAALASTAAFAQTNVTVYGVADLGQAFVRSSATGLNHSQGLVGRLDSNSSLIGFKGVEDLGNGLKAVFQMESNIALDTNVGGLNGIRDTYVGLTGGFGTVVAGNLTHPLRAFGAKVDLLPGAAGFGTTASLTGTILGIKTGADERAANAVAYVSPNFAGFTVTGAYVNGENKTNNDNGGYNARAYQLAAQYDKGPLFVGAGAHWTKDNGTPIAGLGLGTSADARVLRVAAVYTLPTATKLTALYDNTHVADVGTFNPITLSRNAFSLGVAQSFGKNTVGFEYAKSFKVGSADLNTNNTDKQMGTVVYMYELSKRTMLQARYSALYNKEANVGINTTQNFYNNPVANGVGSTANADYSGVMVGLRHMF